MLYCNHQPLWAYGYGYSFRLSRFPLLASGPESDTTAQQHCRDTEMWMKARPKHFPHGKRGEQGHVFLSLWWGVWKVQDIYNILFLLGKKLWNLYCCLVFFPPATANTMHCHGCYGEDNALSFASKKPMQFSLLISNRKSISLSNNHVNHLPALLAGLIIFGVIYAPIVCFHNS